MGEQDRDLAWMQWLARNHYGIDFAFDEAPPVAIERYAEVMRDVTNDGEDAETWAWCIDHETGPWPKRDDA